MSTYFDILVDDILQNILLKVEPEKDLINWISIPFVSKILKSKYFWDLKCKLEFHNAMIDDLLVNFNNTRTMSLFNILHTYTTIKYAYQWAITDIKRVTLDNRHSIFFENVLNIDLLCLSDENNIDIILELSKETLKYFRIWICKDEKGKYYYDIDDEFTVCDIEESKVVTLLMNSNIKQR